MNLPKLNDSFGLITHIGVLIGLVFLIVEINQNTLALKNETDVAVYSLGADRALTLVNSSEFAEILSRASSHQWMEFTDVERVRLHGWFGTTTDSAELQYRLNSRSEDEMENIVFPSRILRWESFGSWWPQIKNDVYEPGFVSFTDSLTASMKISE